MTIFKKEQYKNITIEYFIYESGMFSASALNFSSINLKQDRDINNHYPNLERTMIDIKAKIDDFLVITPKTYKELANLLSNSLTWTGYEDCHLDEFICQTIVGNFIKYTNELKNKIVSKGTMGL